MDPLDEDDATVVQLALDWSVDGLHDAHPVLSARRQLTRRQLLGLIAFVVIVIVGFAARPVVAGTILMSGAAVLYLGALWFRIDLLVRNNGSARYAFTPEFLAAQDDALLPTYTVLVPAYHEPEVMGSLIGNLAALNYPPDKIEVKLLLEADDDETIAAAEALGLPAGFEIVRIPPREPRTKPKALNYALLGSHGEIVTIYDAEDRPDPMQLRKVAATFASCAPDVGCVQAELAYFNADENIITRWFATEYRMWFTQFLPSLSKVNAPIPLGGTSNHMKRDLLVALGAWDPFNVTEDADLGIRLRRRGYRVAVLDSITYEEANTDFVNWVKQRSRWYKGYAQTWLVHMRHPGQMIREVGLPGFLRFNLFVGGTPLLALMNPISWLLLVLWFMLEPRFIVDIMPPPVYYTSLFGWIAGNFLFYYLNLAVAYELGLRKIFRASLLLPVYWGMMSLAAVKAFIQLVFTPSYWEKTQHGLSRDTVRSSPPRSRHSRGMTVLVIDTAEPEHSDSESDDAQRIAEFHPLVVDLPTESVVDTRPPRWSWIAAAAAFVQYTAVGAWLLYSKHFAIGDSLSRTAAARLVVSSRDPHLGAMGFYWMPLPTLARIPFVLLLEPFDRVDLAGPMSSALFAALTIPVLASTGRLLKLNRLTPLIVLIYAISPVTMWLGADGMSEAASGLFLALTMYSFLKWRHDNRTRSLLLLGASLGASAMCRYEPIVIILVVAVAVGLASEPLRRRQAMIIAVFPAIVVYVWWYIASMLIMGDGLYWYHLSRFTTATPEGAYWLPNDRTTASLTMFGIFIVVALAPAGLAVLAGCTAARRRWRTSLGVVGLVFAIPLLVTLQLLDGSSWAVPRFYELTPLFAAIGVMWVVRAGRTQPVVAGFGRLGVVLLAVGALTGSLYLASPTKTHAEGEFTFFRAALGMDEAVTSSDIRVYSTLLDEYRDLSHILDPYLAAGNRVLVDTYGSQIPSVMTSQPAQFIVPEDRDWEPILSDPQGRFQFVIRLLTRNDDAPSPYESKVIDLLAFAEGGAWVKVATYESLAEVSEWVPTGAQPTYGGPPQPPPEPTKAPFGPTDTNDSLTPAGA